MTVTAPLSLPFVVRRVLLFMGIIHEWNTAVAMSMTRRNRSKDAQSRMIQVVPVMETTKKMKRQSHKQQDRAGDDGTS